MRGGAASVTTAPERTCIDEEAPYAGHANTYSRSKRRAEAIIRGSGLEIVIVRPSIVLSRGVRDRAMARSILWAVPIMGEVGEVPIDPDACVDLVPVDYVADAIAQLAVRPSLEHRLYHIERRDLAAADERDQVGSGRPAEVGRQCPSTFLGSSASRRPSPM